jgi:transcriptional regulator with XRE-family HTH domain
MQDGSFAQLGRSLKALRESAGLSQAELARKAGVGKSQLSKYENGKELPKLETLARLVEALGVEPLTLFYTAHVLRHRTAVSPAALLLATSPELGDPALESFRRLFGHFLESYEILMTARLLPTAPGREGS